MRNALFVLCCIPVMMTACDPPLPDCAEGPLFTHAPLDEADLLSLVPLGRLNPLGGHVFPTDHIYFYIARNESKNGAGATKTANVYAPGDIVITAVDSLEHLTGGFTDYTLRFSRCEQVSGYFGHLSALSPEIVEELGEFPEDRCETYWTGGEEYRNCDKPAAISVAAGELLGTAGGPNIYALDFGLFDTRVSPLEYANPERMEDRYRDGLAFHIVCPVDYFAEDVRTMLETHFANDDGSQLRTVAPLCGEVEQDEPGTAQGIWFLEGTEGASPEDPHLALVHDNIVPNQPVFSVGTSVPGLPSGLYRFVPEPAGLVNRDFPDISDSSIHCFCGFENTENLVVLLQMTSPATLKIEAQASSNCSDGPWEFTQNAVIFQR